MHTYTLLAVSVRKCALIPLWPYFFFLCLAWQGLCFLPPPPIPSFCNPLFATEEPMSGTIADRICVWTSLEHNGCPATLPELYLNEFLTLHGSLAPFYPLQGKKWNVWKTEWLLRMLKDLPCLGRPLNSSIFNFLCVSVGNVLCVSYLLQQYLFLSIYSSPFHPFLYKWNNKKTLSVLSLCNRYI